MPARLRSVLAAVLLVVGVVLVPVGVTATWLRTTVTDTDTYVATITPLATDPAVTSFVEDRATARVMVAISDQHLVERALDALESRGLPAGATRALGLLAAPLAAQVEQVVRRVVTAVVESDQFATAWVAANRIAHAQARRRALTLARRRPRRQRDERHHRHRQPRRAHRATPGRRRGPAHRQGAAHHRLGTPAAEQRPRHRPHGLQRAACRRGGPAAAGPRIHRRRGRDGPRPPTSVGTRGARCRRRLRRARARAVVRPVARGGQPAVRGLRRRGLRHRHPDRGPAPDGARRRRVRPPGGARRARRRPVTRSPPGAVPGRRRVERCPERDGPRRRHAPRDPGRHRGRRRLRARRRLRRRPRYRLDDPAGGRSSARARRRPARGPDARPRGHRGHRGHRAATPVREPAAGA